MKALSRLMVLGLNEQEIGWLKAMGGKFEE